MASTFSKLRDDLTDDLEDQVARLQKEVTSLRKVMAKRGAHAYSDTRDIASDAYGELADRITDLLPHVRSQSRAVRRAASDHPVAAAVIGLAVVGLALGLFSRR